MNVDVVAEKPVLFLGVQHSNDGVEAFPVRSIGHDVHAIPWLFAQDFLVELKRWLLVGHRRPIIANKEVSDQEKKTKTTEASGSTCSVFFTQIHASAESSLSLHRGLPDNESRTGC